MCTLLMGTWRASSPTSSSVRLVFSGARAAPTAPCRSQGEGLDAPQDPLRPAGLYTRDHVSAEDAGRSASTVFTKTGWHFIRDGFWSAEMGMNTADPRLARGELLILTRLDDPSIRQSRGAWTDWYPSSSTDLKYRRTWLTAGVTPAPRAFSQNGTALPPRPRSARTQSAFN